MVYPSWLGPKPRENTKTKNQNTLALWVPKNEKLINCSSTLALWPPPKRSNMHVSSTLALWVQKI